MMELTRVYHFSAAHRLVNPALSAEENAHLYGPCAELHGHNYELEVTVVGRPDPVTGMIVDIAQVDERVGEIVDRVDHRTLEDVAGLAGVITTGECLARVFWRALAPGVGAAALARVAVVETANNRFEYRGESS